MISMVEVSNKKARFYNQTLRKRLIKQVGSESNGQGHNLLYTKRMK